MIDELTYREIPHISREGLKATESPSLKEVVEKVNELTNEINNLRLAMDLEVTATKAVKQDDFFDTPISINKEKEFFNE